MCEGHADDGNPYDGNMDGLVVASSRGKLLSCEGTFRRLFAEKPEHAYRYGVTDSSNRELIEGLAAGVVPSRTDLCQLLETYTPEDRDYASSVAYQLARERFGNSVQVAGRLHLSNQCVRDCFFCGLRESNTALERYRLTGDQALAACELGAELGITSFVLGSGTTPEYTDVEVDLIWKLRRRIEQGTITLHFGERSRADMQLFFDAGADGYVLRHETSDPEHFAQLHPRRLTLAGRHKSLVDLREIGFAAGCGMSVGAPFQTPQHLADDLVFLAEFRPSMVDVAPFLPHPDTPLAAEPKGSVKQTLFVLSLARLIVPDALIPVGLALTSCHKRGLEIGVMAGANVVPIDLTPASVRRLYQPFNDERVMFREPAEAVDMMRNRLGAINYDLVSEFPED